MHQKVPMRCRKGSFVLWVTYSDLAGYYSTGHFYPHVVNLSKDVNNPLVLKYNWRRALNTYCYLLGQGCLVDIIKISNKELS
jgi:hypothetical protein